MPLIALELRRSPASFARNTQCRPEVCPDHEKLLFSRLIDPILERYFYSFFMNHHQMQPNLSSEPRFLPSPTTIENP
jgi:hypothetical protein